MKQDSNEFEQIKALLRLKQHEVPPPGFFDAFSDLVLNKIEAQHERPSWWMRAVDCLDLRPLVSFAYGIAVTGLFLCGLGFSQTLVESLEMETVDVDSYRFPFSSLEMETARAEENPWALRMTAHTSSEIGAFIQESSVAPVIGLPTLNFNFAAPRWDTAGFAFRNASLSF